MDLVGAHRATRLLVISAKTIASEVRRGTRTARDTVAGALTLTRAQQERLNVATHILDDALARAEFIDAEVAAGRDPGPLAGVPIAVKDLIDQSGVPTTCGSSFYRQVPDRSAPVIERLESAGAVIISRTGLHEFAYGFNSENHWFGPVRNPLDPLLSPGGSSGGSAAAVAAGQVPIAIGTDTGGSVRVPAALCGILGLKVTHGRVPLRGVFPLAASLDTVGPLAASTADLAAAYEAIAGHDPDDPWSVDRRVTHAGAGPPDLNGVRIGIPLPWVDDAPVTEAVAVAFAGAMARLQGLGATVEQFEDPELAPPGMIQELSAAEAASVHRQWFDDGRDYGPEVKTRLEAAMRVTLDQYVAAQQWRSRLKQRAAAAFSRFDLMATPTTGATRKVIGVDTVETLRGEVSHRAAIAVFTALVNHIGCPAIALPLPSGDSPPPSLQLVAPWWAEHRLLDVAATLESHGIIASPGV